MAFLLVRAVKHGIQAHRDLNSSTPTEERLDRHGRPKKTGAVYNLVQSAERAYQQRQQQQLNGTATANDQSQDQSVDEDIKYRDTKQLGNKDDALDAIDAPPSYDVATSQAQSRGVTGPSGFGNASTEAQYAPSPAAGRPARIPGSVGTLREGHAARPSDRRLDSSSSSSSTSSDSSREHQQNYVPRGLNRDQYRAQKREYKLARRQFKREQVELRRYNREEYRIRKREMRSSMFGVPPAPAVRS